MAPLLTLLKSAVVFRLAHAHADAGDHHDEESLSAVSNWGWSAMAGLPHEASDLTATYVGDSTIILAGGCVSHQVSCDWYEFCTFCPAISNRAFAFDASSDSFEELATMPVSRYRHAAAFSGGEVFLVGGRDVDDGVVGTVDAYSVAGKTWRSVSASGGWAPTSDLNAFAYGGFVYVYGGYDLNYETAATAGARFSTNDFGVFTADVPSLTQGRGDFGLVVVGAFAVAAGGWHEGDWCIPLASTETLDLSTAGAEWQPSNSLVIGRGDVAAVTDGEHSVVLGGEHNNGCATASVPVSDVEMRLGSAWTQIGHIPEQKMRLAAAAVRISAQRWKPGARADGEAT